MTDWLLNLHVAWMALVIFAATYLVAAGIYLVVIGLAVNDRARAFKALSPGMLPPLGIIFGLLVGFIAAGVWSDFGQAKVAVANEASALRAAVLLAGSFPGEQEARLRALINRHIEVAVNQEWPMMAQQHATLTKRGESLIEALKIALKLTPVDEGQKIAQREIVTTLENALDARRQRIIISQSTVSSLKWLALILQALCALIAIAMVHSDNRLTCGIALTIFAAGIALSLLLIAAYSRPFNSVGPALLKQVIATESAATQP
jgi:multisubunit Na+/H+ antiporter MnhC subunit